MIDDPSVSAGVITVIRKNRRQKCLPGDLAE
jgi:hypothetical protein